MSLALQCMISQNGQAHFKNVAANTARFLKCVQPFWKVYIKSIKAWKANSFLEIYIGKEHNFPTTFCNFKADFVY